MSRKATAKSWSGKTSSRATVREGAVHRAHPEDFEKAALKKDRIIDIQDFVKSDAVDDRYFDKPYYLLPGKGGDKAYALLREAIKASGRMGIAKFVLRSKQRLAGIEALGDALVLSTMRFGTSWRNSRTMTSPPRRPSRRSSCNSPNA